MRYLQNSTCDMNGFDEKLEFLPVTNPKKLEKSGRRKWYIIGGIVVAALIASLIVGLLVWHFHSQAEKNKQLLMYMGAMRIANKAFIDQYEDPESEEFIALADSVKETLRNEYDAIEELASYHVESEVTDFSEGSVIAYFWSTFRAEQSQKETIDHAMEKFARSIEKEAKGKLPAVVSKEHFAVVLSSVCLFSLDSRMVRRVQDSSCAFRLHAVQDKTQEFLSPDFPNHPYPSDTNCHWLLRADPGHVIYLSFLSFDLEGEQDGDCKNDYVKVYDSLNPRETKAMITMCGSYPPSKEFSLVSSGNVMLVTLDTDNAGNYPGFKAQFKQYPKTTACGGVLEGVSGTLSSPYFPAYYPPNITCEWTILVPEQQHVKVSFSTFFLKEPNVDENICPKDYVEINNKRYCGDHFSLEVLGKSHQMTVKFFSDGSHTDEGFSAQYMAFEPSNPCAGKYTCGNGVCIPENLQCDGWDDCGDLSEEKGCECAEDQLRCNSGICKPKLWACDGVDDCGDNSDEQECSCADNEFRCQNGNCIPEKNKCDRRDNCGDGSDESECPVVVPVICKDYTFMCNNGECINKKNAECDEVEDCQDGSDEENCDCGKRRFKASRIVGGVEAAVGEFPWQVSLHLKNQHACGASVISTNWLVSAAHCFYDGHLLRYTNPDMWTAYLGLHSQKHHSQVTVMRRFKQIIVHNSFSISTYDNDVALLELETPITFSNLISPVCLPAKTHDFPAGSNTWVTGWGALKEGGSAAVVLQKAEVRIINYTICNEVMNGQVSPVMMCAGFLKGGIDACQGDSGGPLTKFEGNQRGFLAGIVSWGEGCAQKNKPGIYTRVTKFRKWIKDHSGV
uniref:Suppressor of tumorigenicity 14 protein homolog n=1 Tax=Latimeria chalumnae TaxID=7897 RepID=H3BG09_LATCH